MNRAKSYLALVLISVLFSSCESEPSIALAKKKLESGDTASAVFYLREELKSDSLNRFANEFLAVYYFNKNMHPTDNNSTSDRVNLDSAYYYYKFLYNLDSTNYYYLKSVALVSFRLGKYPEAIKYFRKLAVKNSDDASHLFNVGVCKRNMGDLYGAVLAFTEAIKISPNYQLALYHRACAIDDRLEEIASKNTEKELNSFSAKYSIPESNRPNYRDTFAKYYSPGTKRIIEDLTKLLELNPKHIDGKFRLANVYRKQKNYSVSIQLFDELIGLKPTNGNFYAYRGLAKYNSGKRREACEDFSLGVEYESHKAQQFMDVLCK